MTPNRLLAAEEPWRPDKRARAGTVLATLEVACAVLADELGPFLPGAADRLRRWLSGQRLPAPLFPRRKLAGSVD